MEYAILTRLDVHLQEYKGISTEADSCLSCGLDRSDLAWNLGRFLERELSRILSHRCMMPAILRTPVLRNLSGRCRALSRHLLSKTASLWSCVSTPNTQTPASVAWMICRLRVELKIGYNMANLFTFIIDSSMLCYHETLVSRLTPRYFVFVVHGITHQTAVALISGLLILTFRSVGRPVLKLHNTGRFEGGVVGVETKNTSRVHDSFQMWPKIH